MRPEEIVVVIPAVNAEKTIQRVFQGVKQNLPDSPVIIVNDGSTDRTREICQSLGAVYVEHDQNLGKGAALKSGFDKALDLNARVIVTLDADCQHDPSDIHRFLCEFKKSGPDLIFGCRMSNIHDMPFHRVVSNYLTSRLISWRTGTRIRDSQCGFRLIKAEVLKNINLDCNGFDLESELAVKAALHGYVIDSIDIRTIYQKDHSSRMRLLKDTWQFVRLYCNSLFWSHTN
ncbi:MAG: glycosyltransferase family 2 protein [bacterium]